MPSVKSIRARWLPSSRRVSSTSTVRCSPRRRNSSRRVWWMAFFVSQTTKILNRLPFRISRHETDSTHRTIPPPLSQPCPAPVLWGLDLCFFLFLLLACQRRALCHTYTYPGKPLGVCQRFQTNLYPGTALYLYTYHYSAHCHGSARSHGNASAVRDGAAGRYSESSWVFGWEIYSGGYFGTAHVRVSG